jgi:Transport and Golgi organisation 2
MCTVSVLPSLVESAPRQYDDLRLRVVCNRDERRTRAPALPPIRLGVGATSAVMPIDPDGGGTWIAASSAGVVFVLLNVNIAAGFVQGRRSRGTVIPALLGSASVADALAATKGLPLADYAPFRLLVLDRERWAEYVNLGPSAMAHPRTYDTAFMRTSSSLGDALVAGPRRALFARMTERRPTPATQDAFHVHQWPSRLALSVLMDRPDARTVSQTWIEVRERSIRMRYQPRDGETSTVVLG